MSLLSQLKPPFSSEMTGISSFFFSRMRSKRTPVTVKICEVRENFATGTHSSSCARHLLALLGLIRMFSRISRISSLQPPLSTPLGNTHLFSGTQNHYQSQQADFTGRVPTPTIPPFHASWDPTRRKGVLLLLTFFCQERKKKLASRITNTTCQALVATKADLSRTKPAFMSFILTTLARICGLTRWDVRTLKISL